MANTIKDQAEKEIMSIEMQVLSKNNLPKIDCIVSDDCLFYTVFGPELRKRFGDFFVGHLHCNGYIYSSDHYNPYVGKAEDLYGCLLWKLIKRE